MRRARKFGIGVILLLCAGPNFAEPEQHAFGFQTPSHNIFCLASEYEKPGLWSLRCDALEVDQRTPIADCGLDSGDSFVLAEKGPANALCHGDTVANPDAPTVQYGMGWKHRGFTCAVSKSGVRCSNSSGRGFVISRKLQTRF
jgi:hypothetical protein